MFKVATTTIFLSCCAVTQALAFASPGGAGRGFGGGGGGGGAASAPEIDGPAGLAAIAVLVSAGLIAFNRYRKK